MVAYPALRLLIQIVLGILLGHTFPNLMKVWYGITVGLLLITLLAVLLDKKYPNRWFRHTWTLSYLLSVPTGFAAYLASLETQVPPNSILHFANKEVVALTRAESDAKTKNQVAQWTASIERIVIASETLRVSGVVRIRRYQKDTSEVHLKIGEMCWLQGKLEFPKAALNQGEFDYRAFLAEKGIDLLLVSSDKKALLKTGETKGGWLESQFVWTAYYALSESIERLFPAGDERAFIKGVMLGDRSDISDEVRAAFQKTGTIHVLAISGLHIGLIALVLNLFLQRLKISQVGKWVAFGIYTIALVYYSNITGNSPPVKRAVIMAILFELGRVLERKSSSLNTLAAASVIMLALNPRELFSVSFHLTNAAVASILLIYPKISGLYAPEKERWWEQVTKYAWDALALTVAASIGTAPFVSHYFGSVPLLGLLANLFVTDMMSLALFASMLSLFFDLLGSGFGEYYAISAYYLVRGAIAMAEFFSRVPLSNLELKISTSETILFFLIVATVMQRKEPRKCAWLLIGTLLFATGLVVSTLLKEKDEPVLIFNAIGRGSSVIFKTASETVLIDAGVSERQWKRVQKQLQVFRCDTLDAFLQASSPPSIVATVPATQKMLWKDHTLRLQTLVAYRPERALLKVVSKKCRFLVALNPLSLKCSDFFKVPVAMVRLKKFGLREAKALRDWINYAQPRLVSVDLSAMKNPFARKQFYRFAKSMQQIKTTERDGQILFTLP